MTALSLLCFIFLIDAIVGLVNGNNMYTLKPGGTAAANVVTLVVCVLLGPVLWRAAERQDH